MMQKDVARTAVVSIYLFFAVNSLSDWLRFGGLLDIVVGIIALAIAIAFIPWRKRGFSLRTLLIATTLVALLFGLVIHTADDQSALPMRLRYLRIVFSACCGLACVLLIALWVRSTMWLLMWLIQGDVIDDEIRFGKPPFDVWISSTGGSMEFSSQSFSAPGIYRWGFSIPDWLLLLALGSLAAIVWLPWRSRPRTLLIATTLVAMLLGLAVYAASK
jgi:hypothetical protein